MPSVSNNFTSIADQSDPNKPDSGQVPPGSDTSAPKSLGSTSSDTIGNGSSIVGVQGQGNNAQNQPSSSGRFVNLQKYLDASSDYNKDQGGLAGQVVGNISNQANQVGSQVQSASQTFDQTAQQSASTYRPDAGSVNASAGSPSQGSVTSASPGYNTRMVEQGTYSTQPVGGKTPLTMSDMPSTTQAAYATGAGQPGQDGYSPAMQMDYVKPVADTAPTPPTPSASSAPTGNPDYSSWLSSQLQDPTKLGADQTAKLTAMRDAQYKGPQSLLDLQGDQNYGNLQLGIQNVGQMAANTQNEAGRYSLLQQMFGSNGYSQGQQKLDNMLMQMNGDQMRTLGQSNLSAIQAQNSLNQAQAQSQAEANQFTGEANAIQGQTRGAMNAAVGSVYGDAQKSLTDTTAAMNAAYDAAKANGAGGYISQDDMTRLGLTAGQNLYGTNWANFTTKAADPTLQQAATADQYAKFQALGNLLGTGGAATTDTSGILAQFANGQHQDVSPFTMDAPGKQRFANAIQAQKDLMTQREQPYQQQLDETKNALGGDMYVNGGIDNAIKQYAAGLRQNNTLLGGMGVNGSGVGVSTGFGSLNGGNAYQNSMNAINAMNSILTEAGYKAGDTTNYQNALGKLSDNQVIQNLSGWADPIGQAASIQAIHDQNGAQGSARAEGYGNWLLNQDAFEQAKQADAQRQYDQISKLFNADEKLQVGTAPIATPTAIDNNGTTPPGGARTFI